MPYNPIASINHETDSLSQYSDTTVLIKYAGSWA